uniref:Uncharacterized protein n=1 Tax=Arundo donax TaxID=35708 RepID=A0A0A9DLR0_ARUDO
MLEVLELPLAVIVLDHALVLNHPPACRHRVLVLEKVGALVHQRHVALHLQPEPSGAALLPGDAVQVQLKVVERRRQERKAQVRRPAGVDGQLYVHVHVRQRRDHGHDVAEVLHVEGLEVPERAVGALEEGVPHVRAREHDGRHRARRPGGVGRCVQPVGDDVDGVEGGKRRAEAVAGGGDADLLVLVQLHQPPQLLKNLVSGAGLVELGVGVGGRVQGQESPVRDGKRVRTRLGAQHRRRRRPGDVQVVGPLEGPHRPSPRHDDVAPPQRRRALVRGHGDVPHEVGLPAPHVLERRQRQQEERVGQGQARRGVDELGDLVVAGGARVRFEQQLVVAEHARADVRRPPLRVEAVVGGLCELAVGDDGLTEVHVEWVQEAVPRVLAVELAPPLGDASKRRHGYLGYARTHALY